MKKLGIRLGILVAGLFAAHIAWIVLWGLFNGAVHLAIGALVPLAAIVIIVLVYGMIKDDSEESKLGADGLGGVRLK